MFFHLLSREIRRFEGEKLTAKPQLSFPEREALKHLCIARDWLAHAHDVMPAAFVDRAVDLLEGRLRSDMLAEPG